MLWKLSKEPVTGSELSIFFKVTIVEIHHRMYQLLRPRISYKVTAGEWFISATGIRDRLYALNWLKPNKVNAKKTINQNVCISTNKKKMKSEESRKKFSEMAKERAHLIRTGTYNAKAEEELCKKYS